MNSQINMKNKKKGFWHTINFLELFSLFQVSTSYFPRLFNCYDSAIIHMISLYPKISSTFGHIHSYQALP